jgi:uncharacterized protein YciI
MRHFLLIYDYAPDWIDKRGPVRPAHLELARASAARDELQLGGAVPSDDFARADPYVIQGVVAKWRVREWITVVGQGALTRV